VTHHEAGLRFRMSKSNIGQGEQDKLISSLKENYKKAEISADDMAMLDYAVQLTEDPASISELHVTELRNHGFSDLAIHDICFITAYFAFVNRMADGLGVELENETTS
jgi:uncharacterized peroxidase-related enzyme